MARIFKFAPAVVTLALIVLGCKGNRPPDVPAAPDGVSQGALNVSYGFNVTGTDPDGDSIAAQFAWGDGDT